MDKFAKVQTYLAERGVDFSIAAKALFDASLDHTRYSFLPDMVAFAKKDDDIGVVLKIANELQIPVYTRGSGTGCSGGCVPTMGGIVLDVSGINFIEIDPFARIAKVGAGAITADIDKAANKYGLFYAPDPSSHKYSSIGGNIACNAGGLRALKYGCTRENVASLEAYLASGEKVRGALALKKFSVGLNLRDIFIGSEGTLGVVSQACLKLLPTPPAKIATLAFFDGDDEGFEGIEKILRSHIQPCVLEFMDTETVECVRRRNPQMNIAECKSALLAEFDGTEDEARFGAEGFLKVLAGYEARLAKDAYESESFWNVRRKASQAMYELGDSKISQDIVLPCDKVREFFKFYKGLGKKLGFATPVFGHAGDGNYHIHFMYNAGGNARKIALGGIDASIAKAIELGGAISGEHGIGFLKSKFMPMQHTSVELELMRSIKRVFDPKNILNPDKVLVPTDTSNLEPLRGIKLPWD